MCRELLVLKRGRVVIAHFAHRPGASRCDAAGESIRHMRAKTLLAQRFTAQGYDVVLEEPHPGGRRVDVAVTLTDRVGRRRRIAVEVQDSPISVDEVKRRTRADRAAGFFATVWVFTTDRLPNVRRCLPDWECRLPEEVRYLTNRWTWSVPVLDVDREQLLVVNTMEVDRAAQPYIDRDGEEGYNRAHTLRSARHLIVRLGEFRLTAERSLFSKPDRPDFAVVFALAATPRRPWRLQLSRRDCNATVESVDLACPPTSLATFELAQRCLGEGLSADLEHLPTERVWVLKIVSVLGGVGSCQWQFLS
jgi:hypothetical protein